MEVTSTIRVSVGSVSLELTRTEASSLLHLLASELGAYVWPTSPSTAPSLPAWIWDPPSAPTYKAGDWPFGPPVTVAINTEGPWCSVSTSHDGP